MALLSKLKQVAAQGRSGDSEQVAHLYEYGSRYFVCSVKWIAEIGEPSVLPHDVELQTLGETISRHLSEFDPTEINIRDRTKADWPAFQASGARSVKAFEAGAWRCEMKQIGTSFEVWAGPQSSLKEQVLAYSSANGALPLQIGQAVRDALSGAKAMRECGTL